MNQPQSVTYATRLVCTTDEGSEIIENTYAARCLVRDGGHLLHYAEPENNGSTSLVADAVRARLQRRGDVSVELRFESGRTHATPYRTPMGELPMEIRTRSYAFEQNPRGARFEVRYEVRIGGSKVSDNLLQAAWTAEE